MSTAPPVLQAEGLRFGYAADQAIVEGLSLQVAPGERVVLLGGSGCGKSTLLRLLAGLAVPQAGVVRHGGQPLNGPDPRTALLFQQPSLLPWLTVQANVGFGLDFARQPRLDAAERRRRVDEALAAVGLPGAGALWPRQLSGGMAQRVALARALARQPALLLADEPFSALDAITRGQMQALLRTATARSGTALLMVTHDLDEALLLADRVLLLGPAAGAHRGASSAVGHAVQREWRLPPEADTAARLALRPALHAALSASLPRQGLLEMEMAA